MIYNINYQISMEIPLRNNKKEIVAYTKVSPEHYNHLEHCGF